MGNVLALGMVLETWSIVTVILIGFAIHRSILQFREMQHIFAGSEGRILEREQRDALRQETYLASIVTFLAWLSGVLLLLAGIIWLYPGVSSLIGR